MSAFDPNPDYEMAMQDFKRGGWLTGLFGIAGMLVRWLVTDEAHPAVWWVRRLIASGLVGVLAYFTLWPMDISGIYKSVILTTAGMGCPELVDMVINRYRNEGKKHSKTGRRRR